MSDIDRQAACSPPGLAAELTEQLRLLLAPTTATRLGGEFRSGKRINLRRAIAYVASGFRRDKIWMRRARPDKRKYQVGGGEDRAVSTRAGGLINLEV